MRFGPGPVFVYESALSTRRWQVYAGRALFVLALLIGMFLAWIQVQTYPVGRVAVNPTFQQMARLGESFFYVLMGIQISVVMLAAPAAAAGSICSERARGTLLHMLVTDLSDSEIVLGKLGARLTPVFGMIACAVPVVALAALLGGIDFGALAGAFAVSVALAVLGCALALTISLWATRTHEVLMAVYIPQCLFLLSLAIWYGSVRTSGVPPPPPWFEKLNPYVLVFAPYERPRFVSAWDYGVFVGSAMALSAGLTGLTNRRLRRTMIAQAGRAERGRRRWKLSLRRWLPSLAGPSLDRAPVLWREWHHGRPSRLARIIGAVLHGLTCLMAAWGTIDMIRHGNTTGPNALALGFMFQVMFGFLMLSATAPTALAEERARGSLEVLLTAPLSTRSIVVAKWWGIYRRVLPILGLGVYTSFMFASVSPDIPLSGTTGWMAARAVPLTVGDRVWGAILCPADVLASGAMIVSLGLAMATWDRRQGRAIATTVVAYFLIGLGWIFLAQSVGAWARWRWQSLADARWLMTSLAAFSPIAGAVGPLETLSTYAIDPRTPVWLGLSVMIAVKLALAFGLREVTVRTFDRCMSRMPERRALAPAPPRPALVELTAPAT